MSPAVAAILQTPPVRPLGASPALRAASGSTVALGKEEKHDRKLSAKGGRCPPLWRSLGVLMCEICVFACTDEAALSFSMPDHVISTLMGVTTAKRAAGG